MVDPIAVETGDETPAAPPPVPTQAQIDAEIERKANEKANAIADKRIAGLMSANDKKVAALEASLRKLQRSFSNEDDDGVDPRIADLEAELARVQREAQEAEYAREYADVFEDWKALTAADDDAARLEYLRSLRSASQAAPPPVEEPVIETEVPPVLPTQPARAQQGYVPGQAVDARTADEFFKNLTAWPTAPR